MPELICLYQDRDGADAYTAVVMGYRWYVSYDNTTREVNAEMYPLGSAEMFPGDPLTQIEALSVWGRWDDEVLEALRAQTIRYLRANWA